MAKKNSTTAKETAFAIAFLKALKGDYQNVYLITAVVAWLRQESGGLSRVIGNNPFNLRPGADDARFRSGIRTSRNGNGRFSMYATLAKGAQAAANRLLKAGNDYRGYAPIVKAVRGNYSKRPEDQQLQARDFLKAVAMSKWDASHYGAVTYTYGPYNTHMPVYHEEANHLIKLWRRFTGVTMPPVKTPTPPAPPPKARPSSQQSIYMQYSQTFIDPYAARRFYEARNDELTPLAGGV